MAFTTGTATDYVDLLDKLRLYLVAQGWTQLAWTAGTVSGGGGRLTIRGPGAGAGKQVFVEVRTESNVSLSHYGWKLRGATDYDSGASEGGQPGDQGNPAYFNLWQNTINYRFFVNDRRFIVVAKMGTVYCSMYAGFFLPWAAPDAYPFPLYIGGTFGQLDAYNVANASHRFFADPGGWLSGSTPGPSAWMRNPGGQWRGVSNHRPGTENDYQNNVGSSPYSGSFIFPFFAGESHSQPLGPNYFEGGWQFWENVVRTRQDETCVFPLSLHSFIDPPFGALDGVYLVPGIGLASEQTITADSRTFRAIQNIFRSSPNDFIAIEEI